jgi:hypothetical protein
MTELTTNDGFQTTENESFIESSTIKLNVKSSSSFLNEKNIGWILSLIVLFCLTIILTSFLYGIWTIQGHYRFIWYIPFDHPIQFLGRRSLRSSTRSDCKIKTLSQICDDLLSMNSEQQDFDSVTMNSSRSTPTSFYF